MPKGKGRFAKFIIYGDDPEALASFYAAVFGWKVTRFKLSEHLPREIMIDDPRSGSGAPLRGHVNKRDASSPVSGFECIVWVKSIRRTAVAVRRHGGRVVSHLPFVKGIGGLLRFHDPAGNVVQAAEAHAEGKSKATSNKRLQRTRSAPASRRSPRR